jgi:uncharacterized membrane protein
MGHITLYLQAFITYVVVDIGYQLAVGFSFFTHFIEGAQLDFYVEPTSTGLVLMLVFFTLIAIANVHLCILPAIAAKSVSMALKNGALLGTTAYATLGLTNGWSIGTSHSPLRSPSPSKASSSASSLQGSRPGHG